MDLVAPDFYKRAACRGADPEIFFDPDHEPSTGRPAMTAGKMKRRALARAFCERCPVREDCLEIGWSCSDGIFGGLDKDERRRITVRRRKAETATLTEGDEPEEMTEDELAEARELGRILLRQGKSIRDVMAATNLGYHHVIRLRNRMVMDYKTDVRVERPDPPRTWGPGTECYHWWERRWLAGQYLGQRQDGKILVQSKSAGPTVRRWCDPQDVVIRPDVARYQATKGNRKDLDVGPDQVDAGGAEAGSEAA